MEVADLTVLRLISEVEYEGTDITTFDLELSTTLFLKVSFKIRRAVIGVLIERESLLVVIETPKRLI
jgi:hypothetical protein